MRERLLPERFGVVALREIRAKSGVLSPCEGERTRGVGKGKLETPRFKSTLENEKSNNNNNGS